MSGDSDDSGKVTMFPDGTIKTRPKTKEYEEGWDRIFNKEKELDFIQHSMFVAEDEDRLEVINDLKELEEMFDIEVNDNGQVLWKQKI